MNYRFQRICLFGLFILFFVPVAHAQQDTTEKPKKNYKNIIRYNITNPLIFGGKTMIWGYERVLNNKRSLSLNVGLFEMPKLNLFDINSTNDSIQLTNNTTSSGYNFSLDYRFYLAKENKYNAPRGVYLAPYVNYTTFKRTNTWTLNTSSFTGDVNTEFNLTIATLGGELGYQFILWNRVAIDLILIGPGMSNYDIEAKLSTTLDADEQSELLKIINEAIQEKVPGYSLVIDDAKFEKEGTTNTTTVGFRYMVHVGFRF